MHTLIYIHILPHPQGYVTPTVAFMIELAQTAPIEWKIFLGSCTSVVFSSLVKTTPFLLGESYVL